jgi:hypothetical protein
MEYEPPTSARFTIRPEESADASFHHSTEFPMSV